MTMRLLLTAAVLVLLSLLAGALVALYAWLTDTRENDRTFERAHRRRIPDGEPHP